MTAPALDPGTKETLVSYFATRSDRDAFAFVAGDMGGVLDEVTVYDAAGEDFEVTGVLATHLRTGQRPSALMATVVAQAALGFGVLRVERHVDGFVADRLV